MGGGRHHLVPGSHWGPSLANIVRNVVVSDVTVGSHWTHRTQLSGVRWRVRVWRVARAGTVLGEEMLRWRSSRWWPGVSGPRTTWGTKLHLKSWIHHPQLFIVVQLQVLQVLHVHLLLLLPGHHLRLLPLLGGQGLSSGVVGRPDGCQIKAWNSSRVRDRGGWPRAGRRSH